MDQERSQPDHAHPGQGRAGEAVPAWVRPAVRRLLRGAAGLGAAFWLFDKLRALFLLLLVSLFVAFAIEPAVNALARHGWRRGPATRPLLADVPGGGVRGVLRSG